MQSLSQNPYSPERWSNIKVSFELVDVDAAENAAASVTSEAAISELAQTHDRVDGMDKRLASLEHNYFVLDGSYILPDERDNGQVGWWSGEMSEADGTFTNPQVLEFNFTSGQSSIGFTIVFDDKAYQYASDFSVEAYDGDGVLLGEDVVAGNNQTVYISDTPVDGYRKVKLTFLKTPIPYRRVRIAEVVFGIVQMFDDTNTTELNLLYEISPWMENIPTNELSITVENLDRRYNMINPQGIYKYLQEGQALDIAIGVGETQYSIEQVNMGRVYYTSSSAEDKSMTAKLLAHDWFYFMEGICRIGTTGTWVVAEAVAAVIVDSELPIMTNIPAPVGARIIGRCIPPDVTHKEAIRLIAQAAGAVCFFNREDELEFVELALSTTADTLDNSKLTEPAKVSVADRINKVEVTSRDEYADIEAIYTASNKEAGEVDKVQTVNNPLVISSDTAEWILDVLQKRITYSLPERGNPAREVGDTVKIYDAYNENRNAITTQEEFWYSGYLKANTEAWEGM
ncbi:hypothetical protein Ami103574_04495 [Aminipila butyrica]|uniref:Uncharacterized protein n=1 Tax=Aminipila butyrica TaxID=433296 RepID=A0A858BTE3_9FIRM|nr:hypothetical protein [Aminipila butyrica]QIB68622.1 hypothetical protein Ami103574_04495 [Aminipila butyrica]